MVTLQLVNLATKIMIIFHLTIYMIHYLYFFVFYGWFLNFLKIRGFSEFESHELVFVLSYFYFILSIIYINTPFFLFL